MPQQVVNTPFAEFTLESRGHIVVRPDHKTADMGKDQVAVAVQSIIDLVDNSPYVSLLDLRQTAGMLDYEAQKYMADSRSLKELRLATAVLSSSLAHRVLAKAFMRLIGRDGKIMVFSDEKAAREWLEYKWNSYLESQI